MKTLSLLPDHLVLPSQTFSGSGCIQKLLASASTYGIRGLLVHGKSLMRSGLIDAILKTAPHGIRLSCWEYEGGEPRLEQLTDLLETARNREVQWIAAIGGGSVLDIAKAAAGLFNACHLTLEDYFSGATIDGEPIPFIAAPTTAGTGSEATMNAVLINEKSLQKKSIRDPRWTPVMVFLDPDLLLSCPRPVIASSGMDALTQAIEAYTSLGATVLSDMIAHSGISLLARSLVPTFKDISSAQGREDLLYGSYLAGLALAMAKLGVVHGIAHPLGARFRAPHGQICAVALPLALEINRPILSEKYSELQRLLGGDPVAVTRGMLEQFAIENPFRGKSLPDREKVVSESLVAASTKSNPKTITADDLRWMLDRLFN